ncbi:MAG: molybdopterin-guanine dinucleotide biosynthesis protein B [Methanocorpusculum sp.]|nr:molybdopterin-guanine dinucleotide biosynthesis protein B [Methanocorpusculum sp.]MDD2470738.1 molybdopterin-guanine dinucleotide biosynthesis protein B [Methanocorpusculum sp.]
MRIINIIGHSNSGKTTIITKLVPLLANVGTVGTIKHMGHHIWELPPGKDTTVHFEAGAACGAGIDVEKTMLTLRGTDVYTVLDFYAWMGYDYAVVEGFKEEGFSCAVLGDLEAKNVILTNPTLEEIFAARNMFDEYVPKRS